MIKLTGGGIAAINPRFPTQRLHRLPRLELRGRGVRPVDRARPAARHVGPDHGRALIRGRAGTTAADPQVLLDQGRRRTRDRRCRRPRCLGRRLQSRFGLLLADGDAGPTTASPPAATTQAARPIAPVGLSAKGLRTLTASIPQPIYWAGPKPGYLYELTRTSTGKIFIRYLPPGTPVGIEEGDVPHRRDLSVPGRAQGPQEPQGADAGDDSGRRHRDRRQEPPAERPPGVPGHRQPGRGLRPVAVALAGDRPLRDGPTGHPEAAAPRRAHRTAFQGASTSAIASTVARQRSGEAAAQFAKNSRCELAEPCGRLCSQRRTSHAVASPWKIGSSSLAMTALSSRRAGSASQQRDPLREPGGKRSPGRSSHPRPSASASS